MADGNNVISVEVRRCEKLHVACALVLGKHPLPAMESEAEADSPLKEERGLPRQIRLDNGPELISNVFSTWCDDNKVDLAYIQKGKPQQNGFAERVNGSMQREFLDAYLFESLSQVREMAWVWRLDYSDERPHESLGDLPPSEYQLYLGAVSVMGEWTYLSPDQDGCMHGATQGE